MENLSDKEKQEFVNSKLLNVDQIAGYAKKVFSIMDGFNIRFPVLAIIDVDCDDRFSYSYHSHLYSRKAEWKQINCYRSTNFDVAPVISISGGQYATETIIGYLTMDTPWEDIKKIMDYMHVDPGFTD